MSTNTRAKMLVAVFRGASQPQPSLPPLPLLTRFGRVLGKWAQGARVVELKLVFAGQNLVVVDALCVVPPHLVERLNEFALAWIRLKTACDLSTAS